MTDPEPFFRRETVLRAIAEIVQQRHISIFAGAGVTIDRSGLTWSALIASLLRAHVGSEPAITDFIDREGPLFAASAAHYLQEQASDVSDSESEVDTRQRMVDSLRVSLYSPGTWRTGDLALSIADAAYAWRLVGEAGERSSCVVTTNYDDYVFQALKRISKERRANSEEDDFPKPPHPALWFPTDRDALTKRRVKRASWTRNAFDCVGEVPCIYLHGYIPRNPSGAPAEQRFPVVSEDDYFTTAPHSERALRSLMRTRSTLIVGASVTDPPLIRALEATKSSAEDFPRWVLVPFEPSRDGTKDVAWSERQRLIRSRLESLELRPIFVDFYSQLSQFFRELIANLEPRKLAKPPAEVTAPAESESRDASRAALVSSYYRRLGRWWDAFGLDDESLQEGTQWALHDYFNSTFLPDLRQLLGTPQNETMKIELWLRWDPVNRRELRLFASSVGIWRHYEAMRTAGIPIDGSDDPVAQAFRTGRPFLSTSGRDVRGSMNERSARWQTSLLVPIRCHAVDDGIFTSGVFVLSSMTTAAESSLSESQGRSKLAKVVEELASAGDVMCDPDSYEDDD